VIIKFGMHKYSEYRKTVNEFIDEKLNGVEPIEIVDYYDKKYKEKRRAMIIRGVEHELIVPVVGI
jgi:hypothetical protein